MEIVAILKEVWENIVPIVAIVGMMGTIVLAYIRWSSDRGRLSVLEKDRDKMREDFEDHKKENVETFKDIRESIHTSNQAVVDKVDELKDFLLHSKITIKGYEEQNRKRN